MNITFLIGNGFDLNLGLNTSYKAFIKSYVSDTAGDSDLIKKFKHDIEMNLDTWANAELALGRYTKGFSGEFAGKDYLTCYHDFKRKLADYIKQEEDRINSCDKDALVKGFVHGLNHFTDGFRLLREAHISESLIGSHAFTFDFINFNYTRTVDLCVNGLKAASYLIDTRAVNPSRFPSTIGESIHVHGYVDRDMVLAVNDESQIATPEIFADMLIYDYSQLIKKEANDLSEDDVDARTLEILNKGHFIYVYGMSLGETDKLWWQRIGQLLCKKPKLQVIIHCHDAPDDSFEHFTFLAYENSLRNKLCRYCDDLDIDILAASDRVHVTGHNIFAQMKDAVIKAEKDTKKTSIA